MARSSVLRRSMALWRRQHQCLAPGLALSSSSLGNHPLQLAGPVSRLRFPTGVGEKRDFSAGKSLGAAVVDQLNNAAAGGSSNTSKVIFHSRRPPLKVPQDPSMDVTTFILNEKENIGERPALVDSSSGNTLTYSDLYHEVCSVELGLVSIGVRQGDVVMLLSRNSVHYPVIFLSTTSVGGILSTVSPLSSPVEVKKQAEASGARVIIVEEEFLDKVSGLGIPLVIIEKGEKLKVGSTEVPFSELLASDPSCCCAPETKIDQDDPALLVYTSGSTGPSKAVTLSHRNIIAQVVQTSMLESGDGTGVHLCGIPMAHVFGMVVITLQQLYRGGTVVVTPKLEVGEVPGLVESNKVTHLYALPNTIANLVKMMTTSSTRLSSLQRVVSGGAPLGKELIDEFSKHIPGASFVQIYGLTEAAGAVAMSDSKEDQTPGSVGMLLSGIQAKVVSGGVSVGPNVQGELYVRGPNIMKGYPNGSGTTSGVDADGWVSTGDVVNFDDERKMYVVGRSKEVIHKASEASG